MTAFSETNESFIKRGNVVASERNYQGLDFAQELVNQSSRIHSQLDGENKLGFGHSGRANNRDPGARHFSKQFFKAGLSANNRYDGRAVQRHTGSPNSP